MMVVNGLPQTLSEAERGLAQVDKRGLLIIYGVGKFGGSHFTIITDHKQLLVIFGPNKSLPVMAPAVLGTDIDGHDHDIRYRSSATHCNADALSRLPVGPDLAFDKEKAVSEITTEVDEIVQQLGRIRVSDLADDTNKDTDLSEVLSCECDGWVARTIRYIANIHYRMSKLFIHPNS